MGDYSYPPPQGQSGYQPMRLGALLENILQVLKTNVRLFLGIASVPSGMFMVFMLVMLAGMFAIANPFQQPGIPPDPAKLVMLSIFILPIELVFLMVYALFEAASNYAALRVLDGFPVTFGEAYRAAWRKAGRYFWLQILRALIIAVPIIIVVGIFVAFGAMSAYGLGHRNPPNAGLVMIPIALLGEIAGLVWAALAMTRIALAYPASLTEDLSAWQAIRRSVGLTRVGKARIFLMGLVIVFLNSAGVFVMEIALFAIGAFGMLVGAVLHLSKAAAIGGGGVLAVVFLAGMTLWSLSGWVALCIGTAVLYRDHRLRADGAAAAGTI